MVELLVVTAIIAVMAAFVAPVFLSVTSAAKKTVCVSNFKQVAFATSMYVSDYDDTFMPVSYKPGDPTATSKDDRTWVQLILPYASSFGVFLCPSDYTRHPNIDATYDSDAVPGDLFTQYYMASKHTNMGFNYMAISPVIRVSGAWVAAPRVTSEIANQSSTMMYVDSAWDVGRRGDPSQGGDWLVVPPCRYSSNSVDLFSADGKTGADVFAENDGWSLGPGSKYGGAWPWHFNRVTVGFVDGSVTTRAIGQLEAGCTVQPGWRGIVNSLAKFGWTAVGQ
jgi:type II secretory pathway pseudopilin PulG